MSHHGTSRTSCELCPRHTTCRHSKYIPPRYDFALDCCVTLLFGSPSYDFTNILQGCFTDTIVVVVVNHIVIGIHLYRKNSISYNNTNEQTHTSKQKILWYKKIEPPRTKKIWEDSMSPWFNTANYHSIVSWLIYLEHDCLFKPHRLHMLLTLMLMFLNGQVPLTQFSWMGLYSRGT